MKGSTQSQLASYALTAMLVQFPSRVRRYESDIFHSWGLLCCRCAAMADVWVWMAPASALNLCLDRHGSGLPGLVPSRGNRSISIESIVPSETRTSQQTTMLGFASTSRIPGESSNSRQASTTRIAPSGIDACFPLFPRSCMRA